MTITASANSVTFMGNGATTVFPYTFAMPGGTASVLYTTAAGVQSTVSPSAYTLTGVGQPTAGGGPQGGTLTYAPGGQPIPAGSLLTLIRTVPDTQIVSLTNQGGLWPLVTEGGLDTLEMQIQQLAFGLARAIVVNPADTTLPPPLPIAAARALQLLGFDGSGNPIVAQPASALVSSAMQPVVAASAVAAALILLGVSAAMEPVVGASTVAAALILLGGAPVSAAMAPIVAAATTQLARAALLPTGATHAPAVRGNTAAIGTAFTGDLSEVGWAFPYTISGVATLGQPASGYLYTPENSMYFDYLLTSSGWNQNTADNNGRTAATCHFTRIDQQGQGDCMGYVVIGTVSSARAGATSWLATPAISAYDSDFTAAVAHAYLNPRETNMSDGGFDCAAIGDVVNCFRAVSTAALGDPWIAYRVQSVGAAAIDAAFSVSGKVTIGLDLTTAVLGTQQAAITLKTGQRLYFQATNADPLAMPKGTNPSGAYIACDPTGLGSLVLNGTPGGGGAVSVNLSGGALVTITGELLISGGPCLPLQDNTQTLGGSSNRWSQLFAGTATINTSDATHKAEIADIPAALLDAWDSLSPRAFKFIAAIAEKGAAARTHTGYIAQEFAAALLAQKLVPAHWAAWCLDILTSGDELQGLRYEELFAIGDAAHRRRMGRFEARLTALETRT